MANLDRNERKGRKRSWFRKNKLLISTTILATATILDDLCERHVPLAPAGNRNPVELVKNEIPPAIPQPAVAPVKQVAIDPAVREQIRAELAAVDVTKPNAPTSLMVK